MAHLDAPYNRAFNEALGWLRASPRFQCLPSHLREEAASEVLMKLYDRKLSSNQAYTQRYVLVLLRFALRHRPDPYIAKARRRADARERWGMQTDNLALAMTRRWAPNQPIDDLSEEEDRQTEQRQRDALLCEVEQISPREREVIQKFLRGEELTDVERNVKYRVVKKLKHRLSCSHDPVQN